MFGEKQERSATLRADWMMPTPPSPKHYPVAFLADDTWSFYWEHEEVDEDPLPMELTESGWPFVEGRANAADMQAAGFEVSW